MHEHSPAMITSMLLPWTEQTYVEGLGSHEKMTHGVHKTEC